MSDIVLSAALRNNLLSLQNTQDLINKTQLRLATGLKVNSALDNPSSFFTSQSLNNRAGDLTRLLDGIGLSIQTIQEADKGVTSLTTLIQQAQSVAEQAQSESQSAAGFATVRSTTDLSNVTSLVTGSGGAITANDDLKITFQQDDVNGGAALTSADINISATDSIYNVVANINADSTIQKYVHASVDSDGRLQIASLKEGGIIRITDGTTSPGADGFTYLGLNNVVGTENTLATTRQAGTIIAGKVIQSAVSAGTTVNGKYQASDTLLAAGYLDGAAAADTVDITIAVDGAAGSAITVAETSTVQQVIDGINNDAALQTAGVSASFDTDTGRIKLQVGDKVGQVTLKIDGASANNAAVSFGFGTGASDNADLDTTESDSENFTFVGSSANLKQFESDYNNVRSQIDALVKDASFRGVNLLNGNNLTTSFNEDGSSTLVTKGADFTSLGLGLNKASFTDNANVQKSLDEALNALGTVRDFGQSIANNLAIIQTRQDFTNQTITTLKAGADSLVVADQNEEGANLLALQTRQALGVTSLSLASQSQQAVLRLF